MNIVILVAAGMPFVIAAVAALALWMHRRDLKAQQAKLTDLRNRYAAAVERENRQAVEEIERLRRAEVGGSPEEPLVSEAADRQGAWMSKLLPSPLFGASPVNICRYYVVGLPHGRTGLMSLYPDPAANVIPSPAVIKGL